MSLKKITFFLVHLMLRIYEERNVEHCVNQLYFTCNTNFVYFFYYYIIIELVSFSCHCTKGTIYATTRISIVDTIRVITTKFFLYISYKLFRSNEHIKIVILSSFLLIKFFCIVYIYKYRCI